MPRLHDAAEEGKYKFAERYLNEGDNIDEFDDYWKLSPLMYASMHGHLDVVNLLVNRGANLDLQGGLTDKTALMFAVCFKRNDIVKLLIRRGANTELRSKDKNTVLILATLCGNVVAGELLVAAGASKEAPGLKRWSAIRWADRMVAKDEWGKALSVTKQTSEIVLRTLNKTPEHMMSLLAKRAKDEAEARMEKMRAIRQKEMQERVRKEREEHDKLVADREAREYLERIQAEYAASRPRSKQDDVRPSSTGLRKAKLKPLTSKR